MLQAPFSYLQQTTIVLPILAAGAFSILVTTWSWRTSGTLNEKQFDLVKVIGLILMGILLLAQSILSAWGNRIIARDFAELCALEHSLVEFTPASAATPLRDPLHIKEFKRLLKEAESVSTRRTRSVREIAFSFPGTDSRLFLGRDSANADEFWLHIDRPASYGRGPWLVKQFHSPDLTRFMDGRVASHP